MPRKLTSHRTSPLNRRIEVTAHDETPGTGCAPAVYGMTLVRDDGTGETCSIRFQNGPCPTSDGFNGFTIEALLAICEDKLSCHQQSSLACRENACALTHLQECMMWLGKRTRDREQRGVEGQLVK